MSLLLSVVWTMCSQSDHTLFCMHLHLAFFFPDTDYMLISEGDLMPTVVSSEENLILSFFQYLQFFLKL